MTASSDKNYSEVEECAATLMDFAPHTFDRSVKFRMEQAARLLRELNKPHSSTATMRKPAAWLHREHSTAHVITESVKQLWLKARPEAVKNYTVPLFFGDTLGDGS